MKGIIIPHILRAARPVRRIAVPAPLPFVMKQHVAVPAALVWSISAMGITAFVIM